jgi:hypothetical protein
MAAAATKGNENERRSGAEAHLHINQEKNMCESAVLNNSKAKP